MISLSIELSSDWASLALTEESLILGSAVWSQTGFPGRRTFAELTSLFDRSGIQLAEVDTFIVGRGPGTYSALRIATATARSFALPGDATVYAVSSGSSIAREMRSSLKEARPVAVVGDARRGSIWIGSFDDERERVSDTNVWRVVSADSFPGSVPEDTLFVSPQWSRLQSILPPSAFTGHDWHSSPCFPDAAVLAQVAMEKMRGGVPSEPLVPLYLHPPVAPVRPGGD